MRVLVADPVAEEGILMLREAGIEVTVKTGLKKEDLLAIIAEFDGLIVRSETQVTEEVLGVLIRKGRPWAPGRKRSNNINQPVRKFTEDHIVARLFDRRISSLRIPGIDLPSVQLTINLQTRLLPALWRLAERFRCSQ